MKNGGVFLGGLGSILLCNLMLIGVCSPETSRPAPGAPPPPPPPPVVRRAPKPVEAEVVPMPLGVYVWGCGAHLSVDPEPSVALPICLIR